MFGCGLFVGLSDGLLGRVGGGGSGGQIGDSEEGHIGSDIVGLDLWNGQECRFIFWLLRSATTSSWFGTLRCIL